MEKAVLASWACWRFKCGDWLNKWYHTMEYFAAVKESLCVPVWSDFGEVEWKQRGVGGGGGENLYFYYNCIDKHCRDKQEANKDYDF